MTVPVGTVDIWVEIVSAQAAISTPVLWAFANQELFGERAGETGVSS
jgi:hypothetical protein